MSKEIDIDHILEIQRNCFTEATNILFSSLSGILENQNKIVHDHRHSLEYTSNEVSDNI